MLQPDPHFPVSVSFNLKNKSISIVSVHKIKVSVSYQYHKIKVSVSYQYHTFFLSISIVSVHKKHGIDYLLIYLIISTHLYLFIFTNYILIHIGNELIEQNNLHKFIFT